MPAALAVSETNNASQNISVDYNWGNNQEISDFDPETDTITFGWFNSGDVYLSESSGNVVISLPNNNQTITLLGISLSELSEDNLIFKNASMASEVVSQLESDGSTSTDSSDATTNAETADSGTSDASSSSSQNIDIDYNWGNNQTVSDFNPDTDTITFGWFNSGDISISEVNGSVVISLDNNNQTITLEGISLSELSEDNFVFKNSSISAEVLAQLDVDSTATADDSTDTSNDTSDDTADDSSATADNDNDTSESDTADSTADDSSSDTSSEDTSSDDSASTSTSSSGSTVYSPYFDITETTGDVSTVISSGVSAVTLAFIVAETDSGDNYGTASWGNYSAYDLDGGSMESYIDSGIQELQEAGVDVTISFGGALNSMLWEVTDDPEQVVEQWIAVYEAYDYGSLVGFDFDIEGYDTMTDLDQLQVFVDALVLFEEWMEENDVDLTISITIPTLSDGIADYETDFVEMVVDSGVDIDYWNLMVFDYGDGTTDMGDAAISAATAMYDYLVSLGDEDASIMITTMPGYDDLGEETTAEDIQQITEFAMETDWVYGVSEWSLGRDSTVETTHDYNPTDVVTSVMDTYTTDDDSTDGTDTQTVQIEDDQTSTDADTDTDIIMIDDDFGGQLALLGMHNAQFEADAML
ncbi:hypothetical protein [Roseibium sp. RKSG952]|uniref:hypothetical protein n=1 Tax=Roseibium sp. RKSG952 TaxID=2529384 RepID=UPI0012BD7444|nr:hypothetical protein [Roseibium sp. RKSG952]MTH97645.1 hypothetical protein [Roseibium sp. RKSG952]